MKSITQRRKAFPLQACGRLSAQMYSHMWAVRNCSGEKCIWNILTSLWHVGSKWSDSFNFLPIDFTSIRFWLDWITFNNVVCSCQHIRHAVVRHGGHTSRSSTNQIRRYSDSRMNSFRSGCVFLTTPATGKIPTAFAKMSASSAESGLLSVVKRADWRNLSLSELKPWLRSPEEIH